MNEQTMNLIPVPEEWHTEEASTCFSKTYMGEGSYYCPVCMHNTGSVWINSDWRPTKYQALCYTCRPKYQTIEVKE